MHAMRYLLGHELLCAVGIYELHPRKRWLFFFFFLCHGWVCWVSYERREYSISTAMARDLFKKIRDTKGIFHAKMGSIKDRNGIDLTKAEDIKKR